MDGKRFALLAGGTGIAVASGALATYAIARSRRKKNRIRKSSRSYPRKRGNSRYKPYTAGKRKDTSRRRIRRTRNGAYYIILASGKARFISKRSAMASRKRKGGKY